MTSGLKWLVMVLVAWLVEGPAAAEDRGVLVFAAASLKTALDGVAAGWQRAGGGKVVVSYAASSALAKQIESGAPADLFFSADLDWMDYLAGKGLIRAESRKSLLGNRIVLVAPRASTASAKIAPGFPLGALLGPGRLALANTEAVPAGKYARAALEKLGVWASVADRIARAENVRAALFFVSRGEVPLGIVYQTDAAADPAVRVLDVFPADTHPPIVYPVALLARSTGPEAAAFLAYLSSSSARPLFEKQGFTVFD